MGQLRKIISKEEGAELTKKFKIFLYLTLSLFLFSTIVVMIVKKYTLTGSIIYTFEALSFMIHGETGFMKAFQIFMATFGGFLIWWILWSFFDVVFDADFNEYVSNIKINKRLKKMKNHFIIVGGGRVGDELANRLFLEKKQFVIIEKDLERIKILKAEKFVVIKGENSDKEALRKAKIHDAKVLIITSPETEKNLLTMLVAKELNPNIELFVRADNPDFMNILEKAGAKKVVVPELATVDQFMIDLDATLKQN